MRSLACQIQKLTANGGRKWMSLFLLPPFFSVSSVWEHLKTGWPTEDTEQTEYQIQRPFCVFWVFCG
jgi:hypothetical protein